MWESLAPHSKNRIFLGGRQGVVPFSNRRGCDYNYRRIASADTWSVRECTRNCVDKCIQLVGLWWFLEANRTLPIRYDCGAEHQARTRSNAVERGRMRSLVAREMVCLELFHLRLEADICGSLGFSFSYFRGAHGGAVGPCSGVETTRIWILALGPPLNSPSSDFFSSFPSSTQQQHIPLSITEFLLRLLLRISASISLPPSLLRAP